MNIDLKKNTFLALLAGGVIVLVVAFLLTYRVQEGAINKQASSPTEGEYPIDTENDGVYYNYQYGFRFDYPKEVFEKYTPIDSKEGKYILSMSNVVENQILGDTHLSLHIMSLNGDNNYPIVQKYNDIKELPLGVFEYSDDELDDLEKRNINPIGNTKKIKDVTIDDYDGFVSITDFVGRDTEPSEGHTFLISKNDVLISINVSTTGITYEDELKRLEIIENIVESFDFFDPQNPPSNLPR